MQDGAQDANGHGTHTAGIMAADGSAGVLDANGFLRGLGMAPGAYRRGGEGLEIRWTLIDTALESPLGQIAMIPMLAWIARSAPPNLKATYFAVMASDEDRVVSLYRRVADDARCARRHADHRGQI